jgi:hypothetical protein
MSAWELRAILCAEETHQQCREGTMSASLSGRIKIGSIRAIAMATFAIFMFPAGIAHAQFRFWPQYTFWPGQNAPFKHKHHHRQRNPEPAKNARPEDAPKGPLQIIISIAGDSVACRCRAWASGLTWLHPSKERFCDSTLASHKARHARNRRARRCPAGRDNQFAPFQAESRVRFPRTSDCRSRG